MANNTVQTARVHNFNAGPSALPLPVLKEAQEMLLNYKGTGLSVIEMSHRSAVFEGILAETVQLFRNLYSISDDYELLFLQGGASLQFSMVPMNLATESDPIALVDTGIWSKKALKEMKKVSDVHLLASGESVNYMAIPQFNTTNLQASFLHITSNNTIYGTQYSSFPKSHTVPLVADMSSDILSRSLSISDFGLIYAGAQKNMGPSGVTVVIIKKDLALRSSDQLPSMLNYQSFIKTNSLYNTPSTFGIYMISLVLKWIKNRGGLSVVEQDNINKATSLYDYIEASDFYYCPVDKDSRSMMNAVFRVSGDNQEVLEKEFVSEATKKGLIGLKGHRLVGGLRASIYNAVSEESIRALIDFMDFFSKNHTASPN